MTTTRVPPTPRASGVPVVGRSDDRAEREADADARGVGGPRHAPPRVETTGLPPAPDSVTRALAEPGTSLASDTRRSRGRRLDYDFSRVRLHSGGAAALAAEELGALAFTLGDHVVLAPGADASVLDHELAHVARASPGVVRCYRNPKAFNFGVGDTSTLKEESFNVKTDKKTKPWIEQVVVDFATTDTDADGNLFWKGSATATYFANKAALKPLAFNVSGGSQALGRTDAGSFTVHRIEGVGYNSGSYSGKVDPATREGPLKRYSKPSSTGSRSANMHFAVFYNRGEALHSGGLDTSSHGCVHVADNSLIRQLNYHSVIGLTKVKVSYPKKP